MSSVDERIVEMRFENDQFERGVDSSLKSIAKLKSGLNLEGASESLSGLQTTANKFDISNISDGVDKIANRFSILGIVVDEVVRKATDGLISMAASAGQMMESLTVDQIGVGFNKYERKIQSVQTIMNATGKSIDEVNASLDKLNWYTDETSYSFTDMVDNIGKFTSSNVELDTAVTSMIGIANAAGLAGVNVQDASHAMEGFSKAIAQGYMSRQNWQWIRTAHMDTAQFKDTLIETALALGTLKTRINNRTKEQEYFVAGNNKATVSVEDFESALKDGWMTTEVMNAALGKFGGTTEEIYKEFLKTGDLTSDIIARMAKESGDLGLRAFMAAQEAKTFSDAINSVRDAVSTGWMISFEEIFGNYEEAKKLWTAVANEMWDVFAAGAERRNELLKEWHENGGYKDTIEAFSNIWQAAKTVGETIREAFTDIFPPTTADQLLSFSKKLKGFSEKVKRAFTIEEGPKSLEHGIERLFDLYEEKTESLDSRNMKATENLNNIRDAFTGLFSVVKLGKSVFSSLISIISPVGKLFKSLGNNILEVSGNIGRFLTNTVNAILESDKYKNIVSTLTSYVSKFTDFISVSANAVKGFVSALLRSEYVQKIGGYLKTAGSTIKKFFTPYVNNAKEAITNFFNKIGSFTDEDFDKVIEKIIPIIDSIKDKAIELYNSIKTFLGPAIQWLREEFDKLVPKIVGIKDKIKEFIDKLKTGGIELPDFTEKIEELKKKFNELKELDLADIWQKIKDGLKPLTDKLEEFVKNLKDALKDLDLGKLSILALITALIPTILSIGTAFLELGKTLKTTRGLISTIQRTITGVKSKLFQAAEAAAMFAAAVGLVAGSLKLISTIDSDKLKESLKALGWIAGSMAAITAGMSILSGTKLVGDIKSVGLMFLEFGASIALMAASIKLLESIKPDDISKGIWTIVKLSASLAVIVGVLSLGVSEFSKGSIAFVSFAASVLILSEALRRIDAIDSAKLTGNMDALLSLMILLGGLAAIGGKVKLGSGIGMLGVVASTLILVKAFEKISDDSIKAIMKKAKDNIGFIVSVAGVLLTLATVMTLSNRLGGKGMAGVGIGMLGMATSLLIVYEAIKKFDALDVGLLSKGNLTVAGILALYVAFAAASRRTNKNAAKVGLGIMAMSASLLVVYLAIKKLGSLRADTLVKGLMAVIPLLGAFVAITAVTKGTHANFGTMLGIAIGIATLVGAIAYLTIFDIGDLAKSVIALGVVLVALGGAMRLASGIKYNTSTLIGIIGAVGSLIAIGHILGKLAKEDWKGLLAAGTAITLCMTSLGGMMAVIGLIKYNKSSWGNIAMIAVMLVAMQVIAQILALLGQYYWDGMLETAASLSLVLGTLGGVIAVLGLVGAAMGKIPFPELMAGLGALTIFIVGLAATFMGMAWLVSSIDAGPDIIAGSAALGEAIGKFCGNIVGAATGRISEELPKIGENLSKFVENAQGFFDGMENIDPKIGQTFKDLAAAYATIYATDLLGGGSSIGATVLTGSPLAGLFSEKFGKKEDKDFGAKMQEFGEGLSKFATAVEGLNLDAISSGAEAAKTLSEALDGVQPTGGIVQAFLGSSDWTTLGTGLEDFGNAMVKFADAVDGYDEKFNSGSMTAALNLAGDLSKILTENPPNGGLWQKIFGGTEWSGISEGLGEFGTSLTTFYENTKTFDGVSTSYIDTIVTLMTKLTTVFGELPPMLSNVTSWQNHANGISAIGNAMASTLFKIGEAGLTYDNAANGLDALSQVSELIKYLDDIKFTEKVGDICTGFIGLGNSLVKFNDKFSDFDGSGVDTAKAISEAIGDITKELTKITPRMASIDTIDFDALSGKIGELQKLVDAIKEANKNAKQIKTDNLQVAFNALNLITEAATNFNTAGVNLGDSLVAGLNAALTPSESSTIGTGFVDGLTSALSGKVSDLDTCGQNLGTALIDGVSSKSSDMKQAAKDYISDFVAGFGSGAVQAALRIAGSKLGKEVAEGSRASYGAMLQAGAYVAEGFVIGIQGRYGAARSAGAGLGSAAAGGARAYLWMNSPSKLFMQIGDYVGEGFVIGIRDNIELSKHAAEDLASGAIFGATETIKRFDNLSSDLSIYPTITPVINMDETSNQISMLSGMLNGQTSLSIVSHMDDSDKRDISELISIGASILKEIQNGSDLYLDDGIIAGRINRRLGAKI